MAKLGISGFSVGNCMENSISHQKLVVYSRGNTSPKTKNMLNCTKYSFLSINSSAIFVVVELELLDGIVELGHKVLAPLMFLVLPTY